MGILLQGGLASEQPVLTSVRTPVVIDFFSGCGGTSAGLRLAGLQISAAVDFDTAAVATYKANFPDVSVHETDIRELALDVFDHLPQRSAPLVFSACAPCQPYSTMRPTGSPASNRDRSLLLCLLPFVDRLRPDVVLVENVPGLQRVPGGSTWNRFSRHLERAGYAIRWQVVDCRDYGVPQRRQRLVMLASRHGVIDLPMPTHGKGRQPYATLREWIGHLPPIEAGETHPLDQVHRAGAIGELNMKRLTALREGGSRSEWPEELWLGCHQRAKGHQDTYGRMSYDATAPVLTTKCTDITNGRYGHPTQNRALSVREAALLQTFPETFEFIGGLKSMTKQVGNAVPVLLAKAMGVHILEHLRSNSGG